VHRPADGAYDLDPLGGDSRRLHNMAIGFHTLAVQNDRRGTRSFASLLTHLSPKASVDRFPGVVAHPLSEDVVNSLPGGEVGRHQPPLNPSFDHIQNGVDDPTSIDGWPPKLLAFRKH
jgi:hypothetical protein